MVAIMNKVTGVSQQIKTLIALRNISRLFFGGHVWYGTHL
jgi:hypothetical protein